MHSDFLPMVYMMASARNGTLYIGVTSSLLQRIVQHREGTMGGFTAKYAVKHLVWFERTARWNTRSSARNSSRNGTARESLT